MDEAEESIVRIENLELLAKELVEWELAILGTEECSSWFAPIASRREDVQIF